MLGKWVDPLRSKLHRVRDARASSAREQQLEQVRELLSEAGEPDVSRAEEDFDALQNRFPEHPEYGYETTDLWERAVDRSRSLVKILDQLPDQRVLEVGCGDGMLGVLLSAFGAEVTLSDIDDWRVDRAKETRFVQADCCKELPFDDNSFDLIISFNSFEHFSDPVRTLEELVRVAGDQAKLHFEFGPLFNSPWGLHAYRSLRMPYPQFLFSEDFYMWKLSEIGISDLGKDRMTLQPMNRFSRQAFLDLWEQSNTTVTSLIEHKNDSLLDVVTEYPKSFRGRGLSIDELTVCGLTVTLEN